MRFAWQRQSSDRLPAEQGGANSLIRTAYNLAWWIPIVLTLIGIMNYRTGFVAFGAITAVRLGANLYLNNVLEPQRAEGFPFRM